MSVIFSLMASCGVLWAMGAGRLDEAQQAMLRSGGQAVTLTLELVGTYALFGGMLSILQESGAAGWLARCMQQPITALLGLRGREREAAEDIAVNLAGNLLGIGGAATPAGLRAMEKLSEAVGKQETASDAMIAFVVLNASGVQILPTTMIALRAGAGARNPSDIVLPALWVTVVSAAFSLVLCRIGSRCSAGQG